ncbi:MAG: ChbG/HpnK family deacetylase, partial [Bacillota bacterium]|nr:ChbG/HpnK family deacetylase [Bacillota bacterium]
MSECRIKLITRGDDCGSNKTANQGILEAVDKGILKNVSLMACCEDIEDAAAIFARKKEVCFGIHTTMNAEWDVFRWGPVLPKSQVPSLVDEQGYFFQTVDAFAKNSPKINEVMAELQAQLYRLRDLGFNITYADQHMFFGSVIKDFDKVFDNWCKREGLINCGH